MQCRIAAGTQGKIVNANSANYGAAQDWVAPRDLVFYSLDMVIDPHGVNPGTVGPKGVPEEGADYALKGYMGFRCERYIVLVKEDEIRRN